MRSPSAPAAAGIVLALSLALVGPASADPLVPGTPDEFGQCLAARTCAEASYDNPHLAAIDGRVQAESGNEYAALHADARFGVDVYGQPHDMVFVEAAAGGQKASASPVEVVADKVFHGDMPVDVAQPPRGVKGEGFGTVEVPPLEDTGPAAPSPSARRPWPGTASDEKPATAPESTSSGEPVPWVAPPGDSPPSLEQESAGDAVPREDVAQDAPSAPGPLAVGVRPTGPPGDLGFAVGLAGLALVGFLARPAWPRLGLLLSGFFARLDRTRILASRRRTQILEFLAVNAWPTMRQLQAAVGLSRSSLRHHLSTLARHKLVTSGTDGAAQRFALASQAPGGRYIPAPLRLLGPFLQPGPRRLSHVVAGLVLDAGYTRSGAWKAVQRLARQGWIRLDRRGSQVWVVEGAPQAAVARASRAPMAASAAT